MSKYKSSNVMQKYGMGWFNESQRHSFARQGIKTGRKGLSPYQKLQMEMRISKKASYAKIPALTLSGGLLSKFGGTEAVKEYRVWVHPNGDDYYFRYKDLKEAIRESVKMKGAEKPLAVVWDKKQKKYREVVIDDKYLKETVKEIGVGKLKKSLKERKALERTPKKVKEPGFFDIGLRMTGVK